MSVQIQWRRDTAANWTSANPTLASGEAGYESDTGKLKIGDGTTAWNSLAYYTATAYNTIQEEGSNLTQRLIMNFIGSGITAEDNSTNTRTNITLDALLNSIADLTATSGTLELTGADTAGTYTVTTFAKTYLDDTNVTNTRSTLGLGSAATQATTVFLQVANNLSDLNSTSTARTNLGLGTVATKATTDFLQVANNLSDLNNTATARTNLGLGTAATRATTFFLQVANNLSDVQTAATARTNLGLGTVATKATTDFLQVANNLSDVLTAATARTNLGLGTAATKATTDFLQVANNLSDLNNTATARSNINAQVGIAFQDESVTTGTTGAITTVNFVGGGVNVTAASNVLTVSVSSGSGDVTSASTIGDNRLVRGDGGAKGIQQSGITIDDSNNITGAGSITATISVNSGGDINATGNFIGNGAILDLVSLNNAGVILPGISAGETMTFSAWDVDGATQKNFITFTSNNTPTCDLDNSITMGGNPIQTGIAFKDEGTITGTTGAINVVNFVGAGVNATAASNVLTVTISGGGATGYQTVQEEGSGLTQRTTLNFIGSAVTAADDAGNTRTNVTMDAMVNSLADQTATSGTLEITGTDTLGTYTVTTFAKTYLDDTNVTNTRSTLGLGSAATQATTVFLQVANNLSDVQTAATARTNLGLGTAATKATTDFLQVANNLSDVQTAATARTNLGLGTAATKATTDFLQVTSNLSDVQTAATARGNLGAASTSQTQEYIAGLIPTPTAKDYPLVIKMPHAGTITTAYAKSASGTGTATFKVGSTALGGGANSVSSTISTISHSTTNTFAVGDTITLTMSGVSSLSDMNFTLQYTRTYS